jgi:hypothetical protein
VAPLAAADSKKGIIVSIAPGADTIVELPKFEVTDSRLLPPPESWHYAEIPGFEILSRISERETKRFLRDFLLLQQVNRRDHAGTHAWVYASSNGSHFMRRPGERIRRVPPEDQSIERYGKNSLFFKDSERAAIVIDFALTELQVETDVRLEADPYRAFYAAYFRFLLRRQLKDKAPPWFEEGLVQLSPPRSSTRRRSPLRKLATALARKKSGTSTGCCRRGR